MWDEAGSYISMRKIDFSIHGSVALNIGTISPRDAGHMIDGGSWSMGPRQVPAVAAASPLD
jgi:hypothetical protein